MEKTNEIKNNFNSIDFTDDNSIINFINNNEAEAMTGTNSDGETIVMSVQKGINLSISTYLDNGFIRTTIYTIDDENLIREELYEPSGN